MFLNVLTTYYLVSYSFSSGRRTILGEVMFYRVGSQSVVPGPAAAVISVDSIATQILYSKPNKSETWGMGPVFLF